MSSAASRAAAVQESPNDVGAITWAVVCAVLKIGSLVLIGAKLERQGVLNNAKRKALSALSMDVCLPCLMFSDVLPEANMKLLAEGKELLVWPAIYCVIGGLLGVVLCALAGTPSQHWGAAAACAAFPNVNGFPVSIIKALGPTLPKSAGGYSAMTFLAIIQLTDGMFKYTIGPMVFKRDLRAVRRARERRGEEHEGELPLGASLRSHGSAQATPIDAHHHAHGVPHGAGHDTCPIQEGQVLGDIPMPPKPASKPEVSDPHQAVTEFGLTVGQCKTVQPEWSNLDAGRLVYTREVWDLDHSPAHGHLHEPLLANGSDEQQRHKGVLSMAIELGWRLRASGSSWFDTFRELFPPQVVAVLITLAIGVAPPWVKQSFYDPELQAQGQLPWLGWVYGTAGELAGGFVPLQMIALGGRMVNVVGPKGPLAASGEAGPRGRGRLLTIAAAVGIVRLILAPIALYWVAVWLNKFVLDGTRPMAFWAPALITAAMPTAANMSTMADLIGSGRSISAASTAMQLLASPLIVTVTLTALLAGVKHNLADDFGDS